MLGAPEKVAYNFKTLALLGCTQEVGTSYQKLFHKCYAQPHFKCKLNFFVAGAFIVISKVVKVFVKDGISG